MNTIHTLDQHISEWKKHLQKHRAIHASDVDELEDHLRSQVETLNQAGLDDEEAFLVAVKRIGNLDSVSREFAHEYSERLWKQLVASKKVNESQPGNNLDIKVNLAIASLAAVAIKIPELFGIRFDGNDTDTLFYMRNFSLFVLPFLALYFIWKRGIKRSGAYLIAAIFLIAGVVINLLPFKPGGHTEILASIHLPIALWFAVGYAYANGNWKHDDTRMNFIRFSGEWFIYYALIASGGGVLVLFTVFIFETIGIDVEWFIASWILPCGVVGAIIVSAYLVEAKQSVIENMAPVLTRLFTPLFSLLFMVFIVTIFWTGNAFHVEREILIGFDLLLVLVLALVLYSISARDSNSKAGIFDILQLILVLSALVINSFALWSISARIFEHGFTPNKVAALGENLILLVNLGWTAVLYIRFISRRKTVIELEQWQTSYVPAYALWAAIVVVVFPIVFRFQ